MRPQSVCLFISAGRTDDEQLPWLARSTGSIVKRGCGAVINGYSALAKASSEGCDNDAWHGPVLATHRNDGDLILHHWCGAGDAVCIWTWKMRERHGGSWSDGACGGQIEAIDDQMANGDVVLHGCDARLSGGGFASRRRRVKGDCGRGEIAKARLSEGESNEFAGGVGDAVASGLIRSAGGWDGDLGIGGWGDAASEVGVGLITGAGVGDLERSHLAVVDFVWIDGEFACGEVGAAVDRIALDWPDLKQCGIVGGLEDIVDAHLPDVELAV